MEKSEFCMWIKHYFLRGKTSSVTKAELNKYYSASAPSYEMVQKWFTEFRCVRESTETIESPGRPNGISLHQKLSIKSIILFRITRK